MKFDKIYEQICEKLLDKSNEENLEEVAPPGEEDLVLALKKQKGVKNPWAIAWSVYNKKHKK